MEHTISHKTRLFTSLLQWWQDAGVDIETLHHPGPTPSSPDTSNTPASLQPTLKDTTPSRPPKESTPSPLRSQTTMNTSPSSQELFSQNDVFTRAREQAAKATSPEDLKERISAFDAGELSQGARQAVFARGDASSPIMVVGEAPGRDEDIQGLPFVGRSGKLLDKMFSAIGFEPGSVYISNIVNWRPPNNRTPSREEMAMCLPFIERHIAFIRPSFLVLAGSVAVQALLRTSVGITKIRGRWHDYHLKDPHGHPTEESIPAMPLYHPAYVLRRPQSKRDVWEDLQTLQKRLQALQDTSGEEENQKG